MPIWEIGQETVTLHCQTDTGHTKAGRTRAAREPRDHQDIKADWETTIINNLVFIIKTKERKKNYGNSLS
jgi:hypothetical protein